MGRLAITRTPFDTLRGRRVFVTGHTGFKGSWLTLWLSRLGACVTGYSLPPATTPNNFSVSRTREVLHAHHEADIRDLTRLTRAVSEARPDVVFHLAAQPLVRRGYRDPMETLDVNIMGTAGLLEAVRKLKSPCVVLIITSDKCYASPGGHEGCRESDQLGGAEPYSASKAAAEIVAACYRSAYFSPAQLEARGIQLATVRAGNVIGGGDWSEDRIITDVVVALADSRPVQLRQPRAVRPWQHVLDALAGYLTLAARMLTTTEPDLCSAWNFGPDRSSISVWQLVELFIEAWGEGEWQNDETSTEYAEADTLVLDSQKARRELGWYPVWDLWQTVRRTADWYRLYHDGGVGCCLDDMAAWESDWLACQRRKPLPIADVASGLTPSTPSSIP